MYRRIVGLSRWRCCCGCAVFCDRACVAVLICRYAVASLGHRVVMLLRRRDIIVGVLGRYVVAISAVMCCCVIALLCGCVIVLLELCC